MAHARAHDRGSLSLADMTLTAQDLDVELPSLRSVRLHRCGSVEQMDEIIDSMLVKNGVVGEGEDVCAPPRAQRRQQRRQQRS